MRKQRDPNDRFTAVKENERILERPKKLMVHGITQDKYNENKLRAFVGLLESDLQRLLSCSAYVDQDRAALIIQQSQLVEKMRELYRVFYTPIDHRDAAISHLSHVYSHVIIKVTGDIENRSFKSDSFKKFARYFRASKLVSSRYSSVAFQKRKAS